MPKKGPERVTTNTKSGAKQAAKTVGTKVGTEPAVKKTATAVGTTTRAKVAPKSPAKNTATKVGPTKTTEAKASPAKTPGTKVGAKKKAVTKIGVERTGANEEVVTASRRAKKVGAKNDAGVDQVAANERPGTVNGHTAKQTPKAGGKAGAHRGAATRGTQALDIARIVGLIESFSVTLASLPGIEVLPSVLKPSSPDAIAAIERELEVPVPADVREFLARGLRSVSGGIGLTESDDLPFASVGFNFLDARAVVRHTKMLREAAAESDDEHARVIRRGLALTYSEPELVSSGGAIYHFSFRNPLLRVANDFSEFLEHYLAAGCFESHAFPALFAVIGEHVPIVIPPEQNVWISAYRKQFPQSWT